MKKKIVMIGPVYPYNSGVAHYTGLMYKSLEKKYDMEMISYKYQYPKFLFKNEQKDYSDKTFQVKNTKYWLHTANPFNCLLTANKINKIKPDMVIIQWLHPYFAPCFWIVTQFLKNVKIVFVCHNVFPHERFPLDRFLTAITLKQGNSYIVQSTQDEEDLKSIISNPVYEKIVHPTYNAYKFIGLSKEDSRKMLNIEDDEEIILFFGLIKKYKGLEYLLKAIPNIIKKISKIKLLIVGEMRDDEEKYNNIIHELHIEKYIDMRLEYVADNEIEKYFMACDIVVLPYISATQSGIAQIAFGFEKPVIVTNVGGLPEIVENGRTGYVVKPCDSNELEKAIVKFFREKNEIDFNKNIREESYRFSWDKITDVIYRLFNR